MSRPSPSVPTNLNRYETTPEITGRIVEYREGRVSFAELLKELSERDYKRPSHYDRPMNINTSQDVDYHEPGTTGELRQARAIGLLSYPEYEAIVSGSLRAHGA